MEGGGSGSVAFPLKKNNIESVLTQLQTNWGELEKGFQGWVCKQPVLVETAAVAASYALQGAAAGLFYGNLAQSEAVNNILPFKNLGKTRLLQVRNFSVLRGTDGAMICAMRRIRGGKDDTPASGLVGCAFCCYKDSAISKHFL
ncbi:chloroplastic import inner membrane translocase subunit HP30-2-like isoform X2 [Papaver somniferum]|uniref:chloroplastic import inner membrane translocase subunit HP30-2-like isoform X2 n=1 Tax=Papaver somniferum TaxID=3469 RepID=UPI000E6FBCC5|nr:chloroplastic import inner membrane translocase subunit HP30-2-like isoform X2 [Papaver somniferum]